MLLFVASAAGGVPLLSCSWTHTAGIALSPPGGSRPRHKPKTPKKEKTPSTAPAAQFAFAAQQPAGLPQLGGGGLSSNSNALLRLQRHSGPAGEQPSSQSSSQVSRRPTTNRTVAQEHKAKAGERWLGRAAVMYITIRRSPTLCIHPNQGSSIGEEQQQERRGEPQCYCCCVGVGGAVLLA
ncbi:hypothetical protein Ddc_07630 [Ditylenchus destructor]|nr:hypothetical protein Ddc_07630 [Ditylenchus destructor]